MLNSDLAAELRLAFDDDREADTFLLRLERHSPDLVRTLETAYGAQTPDLLDGVLEVLLHAFHNRPPDLRRLDERRLLRPDALQLPGTLGYAAPAGRLVGILADVRGHAAYLQQLGVTVLHLQGVLGHTEGQGGDHRTVHPALGTLDDLSALTRDLRAQDLSVGVDLRLDRVPVTHTWAVQAAQGHPARRALFARRDDAPQEAALAEQVQRHNDQWTLNWDAPDVFRLTLEALLDLTSRGVEILQLTGTEHLHARHPAALLHALRSALKIVAPSTLIFLEGEAARLHAALGQREHHGQLADLVALPTLTSHAWDALDRQDTAALAGALGSLPERPASVTWALRLRDHAGQTAADRSGLPEAIRTGHDAAQHQAVLRLRLLSALSFGFGGMPLLTMGDELGLTHSTGEAARMDWTQAEAARADSNTPAGQLYAWTQKLVQARAATPHLHAAVDSRPVRSPDPRVLLLRRNHPLGAMLQVYNFSPQPVAFPITTLREQLGEQAVDRLSGQHLTFQRPNLRLEPYAALWLAQP